VCGSWGAIAGDLRYFADRFGVPRASIEGTQIPADLIQRYATRGEPTLSYDARRGQGTLVLVRRVEYFGFELEREVQAVDGFPAGQEDAARALLADAVARGESRHPAVRRNQAAVEAVRDAWRRSGGATPKLGLSELAAHYARELGRARSMDDFRDAPLRFDADAFVPAAERARLATLPAEVEVRGRPVEIHYDVEESEGGMYGVARLRIPEKVARTLVAEELPTLDRPLRFVVTRGKRGAVRASSLDELHDLLAQPFTPEETRDAAARTPRRSRRDVREGRRGHAAGRPDKSGGRHDRRERDGRGARRKGKRRRGR
jgi:hypothetical protein